MEGQVWQSHSELFFLFLTEVVSNLTIILYLCKQWCNVGTPEASTHFQVIIKVEKLPFFFFLSHLRFLFLLTATGGFGVVNRRSAYGCNCLM